MDRIEKLMACFKELNFKPRIDSFQDKLIIQKTVCLLQLLGVDLGYNFSLYVRGPYSPDLTRDIYKHRDRIQNLESDCSLSENEKEKLTKVFEISNKLDAPMLEIITTYSFLSKDLGMSNRDAIIALKRLKSFYSEAQIAVGVSKAKQLFPPTEEEIEEMKKEFNAWEDASGADARY